MTKKGLKLILIGTCLQVAGQLLGVLGIGLDGILNLAGLIVLLVGLANAGKEHAGYKKAFKINIWNLVGSIIFGFLFALVAVLVIGATMGAGADDGALAAAVATVTAIGTVFWAVVSLLLTVWSTLLIIKTTQGLVSAKTAELGNIVKWVYIGLIVLGTVFSVLVTLDVLDLAWVQGVAAIAYDALLIVFLAKANKEVA